MLNFIGFLCVITILFYIGYLSYSEHVKKTLNSKATEEELIKKFNKVVKSITKKNLGTVKDELFEILSEYKSIKSEHFIETKTLLAQSLKSIKDQISTISIQEKTIIREVKELKGDDREESQVVGARYIYELEKIRDIKADLSKTAKQLNEKIKLISDKIDMFNYRYSLKKSEITIMIANAVVINNVVSNIDIKLNDLLISKFDDLTTENSIRAEITSELCGNTIEKETHIDFNKEVYIEKFKTFSE